MKFNMSGVRVCDDDGVYSFVETLLLLLPLWWPVVVLIRLLLLLRE